MSQASRSKTAMHKRLADASNAKSIVKPMIINGDSVLAIKSQLKLCGIPTAAYQKLLDQGFVGKWRKL